MKHRRAPTAASESASSRPCGTAADANPDGQRQMFRTEMKQPPDGRAGQCKVCRRPTAIAVQRSQCRNVRRNALNSRLRSVWRVRRALWATGTEAHSTCSDALRRSNWVPNELSLSPLVLAATQAIQRGTKQTLSILKATGNQTEIPALLRFVSVIAMPQFAAAQGRSNERARINKTTPQQRRLAVAHRLDRHAGRLWSAHRYDSVELAGVALRRAAAIRQQPCVRPRPLATTDSDERHLHRPGEAR